MMDEQTKSPFSPERLHELYWREGWTESQIAVLVGAQTGEKPTTAIVVAWLTEAGIALKGASVPAAVISTMPKRRSASKDVGPIVRTCAHCGKEVKREFHSDFKSPPDRTYCGRACQDAGARKRNEARREAVRMALTAPDLAATIGLPDVRTKTCIACHVEKALSDFVTDRSRMDLHANRCRECGRAKSRAFYEAHQERQQERARAYKQAKKRGKNDASL
jgi:hypothetical protein